LFDLLIFFIKKQRKTTKPTYIERKTYRFWKKKSKKNKIRFWKKTTTENSILFDYFFSKPMQ